MRSPSSTERAAGLRARKPVSGLLPASVRARDPGLGGPIRPVSHVPLPNSLKVYTEDLLGAQQCARFLAS